MWQNGIVNMYRMLQPSTREKTSVPETLIHASLPTPQQLLRKYRTIVLLQLGIHGSADYKRLVLEEATIDNSSFLELIRQDWIWYNEFVSAPTMQSLPACFSYEEVLDFIATDEGRRIIMRTMKHAFRCHDLQLQAFWAGSQLYMNLENLLTPGARRPEADRKFRCSWCSCSFETNTALSVHQRQKHKAVAIARYYTIGSTCEWCGRNYHTRQRCVIHLQYSGTTCLSNLIATRHPINEEDRIELDDQDRQEQQEFLRTSRPTMAMRRVFLPPPAVVSQPEEPECPTPTALPQERQDLALQPPGELHNEPQHDIFHDMLEKLWDAVLEPLHVSADEGYEALEAHFSKIDLAVLTDAQYHNFESELVFGIQELSVTTDDEQLVLRLDQFTDKWFPARVKKVRASPTTLPEHLKIHPTRFAPEERYKVTQADTAKEDWYTQAASLEDRQKTNLWKGTTFVPKPLAEGTLFCLLPFGGTRRYGDIPMWLEWENVHGGTLIRAIILDLGIGPAGDMLDPGQIDQWKSLIRSGKVCYIHSAPPCETWSSARHLPPPGDSHKPRPLRTVECPWMMQQRDPRELRQTLIGTKLMSAALELTIWAYQQGIAVSVEHPATWQGRASIWSTKAMDWIMSLPRFETFRFNQSSFGQSSLKPTVFLLGNNTILKKILVRHIKTHDSTPTTVLRGLDPEDPSQWSTSKTKSYPPDLCHALAMAARQAMRTWPCTEDCPVPPKTLKDIQSLCPPHDPYSHEVGYAPDFHG